MQSTLLKASEGGRAQLRELIIAFDGARISGWPMADAEGAEPKHSRKRYSIYAYELQGTQRVRCEKTILK